MKKLKFGGDGAEVSVESDDDDDELSSIVGGGGTSAAVTTSSSSPPSSPSKPQPRPRAAGHNQQTSARQRAVAGRPADVHADVHADDDEAASLNSIRRQQQPLTNVSLHRLTFCLRTNA